jgi:hypothetical protein
MRGIKATKLLIAPLLVAPMLVAGFAIGQSAAVAKTKPPKIVCMTLSGTETSPITISNCTGQPAGATQAVSPSTACVSNCTVVETWNDSGSTTTTQTYNAKVTSGKKAKKCPAGDDQAVETGKVTAGYGDGGKSKATVCVSPSGTLSLAVGTSLDL